MCSEEVCLTPIHATPHRDCAPRSANADDNGERGGRPDLSSGSQPLDRAAGSLCQSSYVVRV
jgi:hypothetical protein